jgi:preprotein translocase subunit SecE
MDEMSKEKKEKKEKKERTYSPKAIWQELKKVQWPTFGNLMSTSALVIAFTLLFGAYFFVCELAASSLVSWIVSL